MFFHQFGINSFFLLTETDCIQYHFTRRRVTCTCLIFVQLLFKSEEALLTNSFSYFLQSPYYAAVTADDYYDRKEESNNE